MGKPESARLQQQQQQNHHTQQPLLLYPTESNHLVAANNSTLEKPGTNQNEAALFARGNNDLQS